MKILGRSDKKNDYRMYIWSFTYCAPVYDQMCDIVMHCSGDRVLTYTADLYTE